MNRNMRQSMQYLSWRNPLPSNAVLLRVYPKFHLSFTLRRAFSVLLQDSPTPRLLSCCASGLLYKKGTNSESVSRAELTNEWLSCHLESGSKKSAKAFESGGMDNLHCIIFASSRCRSYRLVDHIAL